MLCLLVLTLRVGPDFRRVRALVPTSSVAEDATAVRVPLPDLSRFGSDPAAIMASLRAGAAPVDVRVRLDGRLLARSTVRAGEDLNIRTAAVLPPGDGHVLTFEGTAAGWHVVSLELSNVFGFSRGLLGFNIVPASRGTRGDVPWWAVLAVAGLLIPASARHVWPARRVARAAYGAVAVLVTVVFAGALVSSLVTPYKILLGAGTYAVCMTLLYSTVLLRLATRDGARPIPLRTVAAYLPHVAVAALILTRVAAYYQDGTGMTRLIMFGSAFQDDVLPVVRTTPHAIEAGNGYDGQFYAQLALDPLLRDPAIPDAIDGPGYRGRRILFPWIAALAGMGRPEAVLQAYALINVCCWAGLGLLLFRWLPAGQARTTAAWAACMLSDGLLTSIRTSVPDGASVLFLALGILALEAGRRWAAAGVFALAGLARETNLLFGAGLADSRPSRQWITSLPALLAATALPLGLWMAYLHARGFSSDAGVRNFALPFTAYAAKWVIALPPVLHTGWHAVARFSVMSLVALGTQAIAVVTSPRRESAWWRVGLAYVVLMAFLGPAVWEGHPGAADRVLVPLTVAFNVLIPSSRWFWPLLIAGNVSLLHGLDAIAVPGFYR